MYCELCDRSKNKEFSDIITHLKEEVATHVKITHDHRELMSTDLLGDLNAIKAEQKAQNKVQTDQYQQERNKINMRALQLQSNLLKTKKFLEGIKNSVKVASQRNKKVQLEFGDAESKLAKMQEQSTKLNSRLVGITQLFQELEKDLEAKTELQEIKIQQTILAVEKNGKELSAFASLLTEGIRFLFGALSFAWVFRLFTN
jgi:chromosome segregation ATPase